MIVHILVTIPDPELYASCMLCFKSLRTGFPTARIRVWLNPITEPNIRLLVREHVHEEVSGDVICNTLPAPVHHAQWIEQVLSSHLPADGPCVILDSDSLFWKSCEDWQFDTPLAGYYIPMIWNDFAKCVSFERLHTSFLWVSDTGELFRRIKETYPLAYEEAGDYCPVNPFMPRVQFIKGRPFFWDSCSALYNMIGGTHFSTEHLTCYDHLNSASFYKVMHARLENKTGFELVHKKLVHMPDQLRGLWWGVVNPYYSEKHQQAITFLEKNKAADLRTFKLSLPA